MLAVVRAVARRGGVADPAGVESAVEEVVSSAHELVEIRLLNDLRSGSLEVPDALAAEMERVLGGGGHGAAERLGLAADTPAPQVRRAALGALARWQQLAESPLAARPVRVAARSVARTCEGIVAALG